MQTITQRSLHNTLYCRDIPVLKYNIQYPSFTTTCSQEAAQAINLHYADLANSMERHVQNVLYPLAAESARYITKNDPPFHSYEFDMSYKITYNSDCITSLYLEQYSFMGGAHGATVRTSDTWDFSTGRQMQLGDFYSGVTDYEEGIRQWITYQISQILVNAPSTFFEDYVQRVHDSFKPESYYLSQDGLVFYFQQYDIAPYATGLPEFTLPYESNTYQQPGSQEF